MIFFSNESFYTTLWYTIAASAQHGYNHSFIHQNLMEWNPPFDAVVALGSMTRILSINGKSSSIFFFIHLYALSLSLNILRISIKQCFSILVEQKKNRIDHFEYMFRAVFFLPAFSVGLFHYFVLHCIPPLAPQSPEISILIWFTRIRQLISVVHAHVLINFIELSKEVHSNWTASEKQKCRLNRSLVKWDNWETCDCVWICVHLIQHLKVI